MTMKLRNVPFSPPDMTEEEANEVRDAILSGWITTGPRVKKLEKLLAQYVGVNVGSDTTKPNCVCLNSQTACAEMTLRILGIGAGDEVIVPAYTYTASASIVAHVGAKLVLVDVQGSAGSPTGSCLEMDYDKMEAAITERTKAIIPVDLAGIPCDYDRIFKAVEAKKHLFWPANDIQRKLGRVAVCCDAAHALGAKWHGRMVGEIADFSNFSFHAVKNFTTAEGGAMTWNLPFGKDVVEGPQTFGGAKIPYIEGETWDGYIYRLMQLLSLHGQNKDALAKTKLGAWEYDVVGPWYKCNMTDVLAALGLVQLERYPAMLERRRRMIARMDEAFKGLPVETLRHYCDEYEGSGHLYLARLLGCSREETNLVIEEMAARGVACNVHYKPLPMLSAYKAQGYDIKDFPNAFAMFENEITLPLNTKMSDEDVEYVIENFVEVVKKFGHRRVINMSLAHMGGREQEFVKSAFDSNWVAPLGPNVEGFERDMEGYVAACGGQKKVAALSSGTAAVHLGLINLGVTAGDEVIGQSFTFCASTNPAIYLGAKPILVDSEALTYNMDPALLEVAIKDRIVLTGRKPKAIVAVHLYGMPCQMDRIREIAGRYGIPVLEDAAEALGSKLDGQLCGTFGEYGVWSFNGNKMITTSGGGALVCPSVDAKKNTVFYATQAREPLPYYQHEKAGFNYRLSNICAGIGRGQMLALEDHLKWHRKLHEYYREAFAATPGITVHHAPDERFDSNYWLTTILLDPAAKVVIDGKESAVRSVMSEGGAPNDNVEQLRVFLEENGIESRALWKPLHCMPLYARGAVDRVAGEGVICREAPQAASYVNGVSESIFRRGLCLPSGPCVSEKDAEKVVECVKRVVKI